MQISRNALTHVIGVYHVEETHIRVAHYTNLKGNTKVEDITKEVRDKEVKDITRQVNDKKAKFLSGWKTSAGRWRTRR